MDNVQTHKDLILWKRSINFVNSIYSVTATFPTSEVYGLTSQIRRAAVSIPSNIAEGYARNSRKELVHFLYIALGSISELDTQLLISKNLNYMNPADYERLNKELTQLSKMTTSLIKYVSDKPKPNSV